jgi:hypothetical protein
MKESCLLYVIRFSKAQDSFHLQIDLKSTYSVTLRANGPCNRLSFSFFLFSFFLFFFSLCLNNISRIKYARFLFQVVEVLALRKGCYVRDPSTAHLKKNIHEI